MLADTFEKTDQDTWVFHEMELFYLGSILNLAIRGIFLEDFNAMSPIKFTRAELEKIETNLDETFNTAWTS